jgi:hypothetical protein
MRSYLKNNLKKNKIGCGSNVRVLAWQVQDPETPAQARNKEIKLGI